MTHPFSVRIFLVDGDPAGIKTVEKTNWSGVGLVFPQSLFSEARKRPELQRTGVYILVGPGDSVQLPMVYIGEGDPILPRLQQHESKKDWWTHAVAFTSNTILNYRSGQKMRRYFFAGRSKDAVA